MSFAKEVWDTFRKIDVSDKTETKQKFTYLPWSDAHEIMMNHYPQSDWKQVDTIKYDDGTQAVVVEVVIRGKTKESVTRRETLPVIDHSNKPIQNPNSMQVNNAVRRCFVKCLALHGLALYLYEGEDVPNYTAEEAEEGIETLLHLLPEPVHQKFYKACGSASGEPVDLSKVPDHKKRPALKWLKEQTEKAA